MRPDPAREDAAIDDVVGALVRLAKLMDRKPARGEIEVGIVETAEIVQSHRGTLNESPEGRECFCDAFAFIAKAAASLRSPELSARVAELRRGGTA